MYYQHAISTLHLFEAPVWRGARGRNNLLVKQREGDNPLILDQH